MKTTKLPQPAKSSLMAFLVFLGIVLIGRHLVADQHQEERIEILETQVAQLEAKQNLYRERLSELHNSPKPNKPTSTPRQNAQPATASRGNTTNSASKTGKQEGGLSSALDKVADKLTEENTNAKFQTPIRLELNTIDSLTLIKVPGIAGKTASTILAYRSRLGGFYSPEQLRERLTWDAAQEHMDDWCDNWFQADESLVQMLQINTLSFKELNHHPYISYEQTKAIVRYREKHKGIRSMAELEQLEEFDDETIAKLKHYISFQ